MKVTNEDGQNSKNEIYIAARMIYLGLKKPDRLYNDSEYSSLFQEYNENVRIVEYMNAIADAMDLLEPKVSRSRIQLIPKSNSAFAIRAEDMKNFSNKDSQNFLPVILIGLADFFFGSSITIDNNLNTPSLTTEKLYNFLCDQIAQCEGQNQNEKLSREEQKFYEVFKQFQKVSEREKSNVYAFIDATFRNLIEANLMYEEAGEYYPSPQLREQVTELMNNPYLKKFTEIKRLIKKPEDPGNAHH